MLNINNLANSDFMTSAFTADYGNALSGVFDLKLRNGNSDKREYLAQVGFNGFEFETAVRFNLPIVAIVGMDGAWGQIKNPTKAMLGQAAGTTLALTRYDKVVEALGGYGELVETPDEIGPALERAFASGKPACVNVMLDPDGLAKTNASTPYIV